MPKFPLIPTIIVAAAIATMVALGFWQLGRMDEKEALIARFEANASNPAVTELRVANSDLVYRTVRLDCRQPEAWQAVAGRSVTGQSGYVHRFACGIVPRTTGFDDGGSSLLYADIGWSQGPEQPEFAGGEVIGTLVGLGDDFKVVAHEPLSGLQAIARPDPNDMPNNHLAYAGQWFFFALTALVIYILALKRQQAARRDD